MLFFSRREKIVPEKMLQIDSMDDALRNRLINYLEEVTYKMSDYNSYDFNWSYEFLSLMGQRVNSRYTYKVMEFLEKNNWNHIFDFIEFLLKRGGYIFLQRTDFIRNINYILADEISGYRLHNEGMVKITNENELNEITEAQKTPYKAVNEHFKKALRLYSDRKNPDYANSIKESISAVEAICKLILGSKQATFAHAIKQLENKGISMPKALVKGFNSIYGYTSDEEGIRHCAFEGVTVKSEDAKFMLVACSAFVNYIIEKQVKS